MSETQTPVLTKKDYESDQAVRWCPGCGDYAILSQTQKTVPSFGRKKEDIVFLKIILLAFFMIKFIVWLKTNDCLKQFIAFYFAVHLMFLLRGDLTNGFSYFIGPLVSIVLLPKLLTRVIK